ncbi:MAG: iron-containing alcohol dehydrogenase, partial [Victivallales bacterium]|nr:iron-containing alcohol dehydrogenase [Victivallales bacterium]
CPATITAASGLDALSQLLESYISTKANAFTDSLAVKAIPGMLNSLNEVCSREPENIEKRGSVAYSSFISGITLANAGLCTVHGLAGVIGGYKNIPHGTICGLLLPYWLEETVAALLSDCGKYRKYLDKLSAIVNVTGFNFKNNEDIERIQNFVMQVKQLAEDLDLPKLNTFGVTEGDLNSFAKEGSNKNNPVKLTAKQKLKILKKAF